MSKLIINIEIDLNEQDLKEIKEHNVSSTYIEQCLKEFFPVKPDQMKVTFKEGPWS